MEGSTFSTVHIPPLGSPTEEDMFVETTTPNRIMSEVPASPRKRIDMEPTPSTTTHHLITYRPDIDGLRALAVIPVVIFHAYPKALPGGFIGVDIFFVISGYLISSILFKEHTKGTFTYADFYSRRIRRIFPALILVLAFSLTMGCLWFLAKSLKAMAATLVASTLFGANLQLMTVKQGYADATLVGDNPLLHLWSLGVEEQFYIFWPVFASLVVRMHPRVAFAIQLLVLALSFICNLALLNYDHKYAFYFPLSRFWQMAIGGLLAYVNLPLFHWSYKPALLKPAISTVISIVGLAAIVTGLAVIDEAMAFPGFWALLPTVGAVALIAAGPVTPFNKYMLGSPPLVFIGTISYPLYLWHWPLLVFARVHYPVDAVRPWFWEPSSMVLVSFVLSVATMYVVEVNLRRRKSRVLTGALCGLVVLLLALSVFVYSFPDTFSSSSRLAATVATHDGTVITEPQPNWSKPPRETQPTVASLQVTEGMFNYTGWDLLEEGSIDYMPKVLNPTSTGPVVVILGDSHANMLAPRFAYLFNLAQAANKSFPKVYLRGRSNLPTLSCTAEHASDVDFVHRVQPNVVFYSSFWLKFLRGHGQATQAANDPKCCLAGWDDPCDYQSLADVHELLGRLQAEMAALTKAGTKVFMAGSNPFGDAFHWKNMASGGKVAAVAPVNLSAFRKTHERMIALIERTAKTANATIVDLSDNQCFDDVCEVVSMREGQPPLWDTDHVRPYFAKYYLSSLDKVIAAAYE
ncbi:Aste57867_2325 [Aphanomyces stellatus]|uniref:Aste57867_2325 protein n=1 Tax=Aphanomyces stellatus TaxID=120398 RepID=A0A485KCH6_9STRA|nr:hypothetical protein As57867_002320 [Aphanomyces stellatus]VFT79527.1 Aste57867_2325 [Aphanomyces stellatus]